MKKAPATFEIENSLWQKNKKFIVGIDEVGRGAWAGPLVASAVVFPANYSSETLYYDSKLLNKTEREKLAKTIASDSFCYGIGQVEVSEINNWGLTAATQTAYQRALENLKCSPDHYLIDAFYLSSIDKKNQTPLVHGDYYCASIAAASIVAKVFRDDYMQKLAVEYPDYFFEKNVGYGTKLHQEAIRKFGLTKIHRTNYDLKVLKE